jgi:ethanolamine ammonia-lyase small subunit
VRRAADAFKQLAVTKRSKQISPVAPVLDLICEAPAPLLALRDQVVARVALGRSGAGLPTRAAQRFLADHAFARAAVWSALDVDALSAQLASQNLAVAVVASQSPDRATYLRRPDLGRRLADDDRERLAAMKRRDGDIAIVIADGLSAKAAEMSAAPLLEALAPRLVEQGFAAPLAVIATEARVALSDEIGALLGAAAVVALIGERPGLSAADSLGAYITWAPEPGLPDSRRNCISNIRPDGLPPEAAAAEIVELLVLMRAQSTSGVGLSRA